MANWSYRLYQWATWKRAIPLFTLALICLIVLNAVHAPFTVSRFSEVAGGFPMIDMSWNYGPDRVHELLRGYGEAGRHYYYYMLSVVDIPFPLIYGFGLSLMIAQMMKWAFPAAGRGYGLQMLPLVAMICDYLENLGILTMLLQYPHEQAWVAVTANLFTMTKTVLSYGSLALIVVLLALRVNVLTRKK